MPKGTITLEWSLRFNKRTSPNPLLKEGALKSPPLGGFRGSFFVGALLFVFSVTQATPQRIISLAPNITEIVYYLGAQDQLIGVTSACDYPKASKQKTIVGDVGNPSLEDIVKVSPDLILASGLYTPKVNQLKNFQYPIKLYSPKKLGDLLTMMTDIGSLVSANEERLQRISILESKINKLMARNQKKKQVKYLLLLWDNPLIVASSSSFESSVLTVLNAKNVVANAKDAYPKMSMEAVIASQPDVILVAQEGIIKNIKTSLIWQNLNAVKTRKVFEVNPSHLLRPGPRIIKGLTEIQIVFDDWRRKN